MTFFAEIEKQAATQTRLGSILFVEDCQDDFVLANRELKKLEVKNPVRRVSTAVEMLQYLRGEGAYGDRDLHPWPIAIILDVRLPDSKRLEALAMIRLDARSRNLPVIAISSTDSLGMLQSAVRNGADAWMFKPFAMENFCHVGLDLRLPLEFGTA